MIKVLILGQIVIFIISLAILINLTYLYGGISKYFPNRVTNLLKIFYLMKTKISQISNLLLFGLIFIFMGSCHQSESFDDVIKSSTSNECSYLSIDKDPTKELLTPEEELILKKAFTRITIINNNGFRRIKQVCGAEINISEPLFDFFQTMIETSNKNNHYQITRSNT